MGWESPSEPPTGGRAPLRTRRWLRVLLGAYAALLLASTIARMAAPQPPLPVNRQTMGIPSPSGKDTLRIAWKEMPSPNEEALPLVLLHGSPGSADNFDRLTRSSIRFDFPTDPSSPGPANDDLRNLPWESMTILSGALGRRTIAPDLPGFGGSDRRVADYSARGHADSTLNLLDRLEVGRFHILGFSMGGAVALHLAQTAPDRVASVVWCRRSASRNSNCSVTTGSTTACTGFSSECSGRSATWSPTSARSTVRSPVPTPATSTTPTSGRCEASWSPWRRRCSSSTASKTP